MNKPIYSPTFLPNGGVTRRGVLGAAVGMAVVPGSASCSQTPANKIAVERNVRRFGAAGDGLRDDTASIQAGIDAVAAAGGGTLVLPPGTYGVRPRAIIGVPEYHAAQAAQFGPLHRCLTMRSGVTLRGIGATIRLADCVSTDHKPANVVIFHASERLSQIGFEDLTIDLNGQHNPVSPSRNGNGALHERYSRMHHAAIMFSGPQGAGDDVAIRRCGFRNSAGTNCIIAGFVVPDAGLGQRWTIEECVFEENGLDTYDHSAIYLWAENAVVRKCTFRNRIAYGRGTGVTGINAACELHGANNLFQNNMVDGSNRGVFVATNGVHPAQNVRVEHNRFLRQQQSFVDLYYEGLGTDPRPSDWRITDNEATFDTPGPGPASQQMLRAVSMVEGGPIDQVLIARNRAVCPPDPSGHSGAFCVLGLVRQGFGQIVVEANVARGFTNGIYAYGIGSPLEALNDLVSRGNRWLELREGRIPPLPRAGVHLLLNATRIKNVIVENDTVSAVGASTAAGIILRGYAPGGIGKLSGAGSKVGTGTSSLILEGDVRIDRRE